MSFLKDRAVAYKERFVRANALKPGNVIIYDDAQYLVLNTDSTRFQAADDESQKVMAHVREVGAGDKVSPNFDDAISVEVVLVDLRQDEDKNVVGKARTKVLFFPEWVALRILV